MGKFGKDRNRRITAVSLVLGILLLVCVIALFNKMNVLWGTASPEAVSQVPLPLGAEEGRQLEVYFLDIGQGDSQLIRIPREKDYFDVLLDTGEYSEREELEAFLRGKNIQVIDALICSHPHTDHMGGMASIIQNFDVESFYMPRIPDKQLPTTTAYEKLLEAVLEKGLVINELFANAYVEGPAGAQFQVIAPEQGAQYNSLNQYSAAIRLIYGKTTFLFTGDMEKENEEEVLEMGHDVTSDVLKVAHHGSKTSSTEAFLEAVNPGAAIISCGKDNDYGLPADKILQRLEKRPLTLYRTDEDGTILARSNGEEITFETGLPSLIRN